MCSRLRTIVSALIAALIAGLPLIGRAAEGAGGDADAYHLVLLAQPHPVILRLTVQVDGEGLKSVRRSFAARLLKQYDQNGDESLDKTEAEKIPPLVKAASAAETLSVSASWVSVDRDPADEKVTVPELADWIDRVLGFPMSLSSKPQRNTQSIDLFGLLDTNHDGRLSLEEQKNAAQAIRKLDLDEDDAFTIEELAPLQAERQRAAAQAGMQPPAADQPLLLLSDDELYRSAAERLIQRYTPADGSSATGLSADALGIDVAELTPFDGDRDGSLNAAELAAFLKSPPVHVELAVQLANAKPGKPSLRVTRDRIRAFADDKMRRANRLMLVANSVDVEWWVQGKNRENTSDNRNLFKTRFLTADRDKNGYVSEEEFGALRLSEATFAQVDRDGNGMIVVDEVMTYVEQESSSSQSRIDLTVTHDGKSVFEVLDTNLDRRLSIRELRKAVELLKPFDRDGDQEIATVELIGKFKAVLELGKPAEFRRTGEMRGDNNSTAPRVNRPTEGPDWFLRMDRNRDGDVTRREFLGPVARFRELDADGDGLISSVEAAVTDAASKSE